MIIDKKVQLHKDVIRHAWVFAKVLMIGVRLSWSGDRSQAIVVRLSGQVIGVRRSESGYPVMRSESRDRFNQIRRLLVGLEALKYHSDIY